jgi:RNHCP domain
MEQQHGHRGLAPNASPQAQREWKQEHDNGGFTCMHCGAFVTIDDTMGTANRNHCSVCLWSKHVDEAKGDRKAICGGAMEPVGLTFKHEGSGRVGEVMLIHLCSICHKLSINRIAGDDPEGTIVDIYTRSISLADSTKQRLKNEDIYLLSEADAPELRTQLFGK